MSSPSRSAPEAPSAGRRVLNYILVSALTGLLIAVATEFGLKHVSQVKPTPRVPNHIHDRRPARPRPLRPGIERVPGPRGGNRLTPTGGR